MHALLLLLACQPKPDTWTPELLQCVPADPEGMATFIVPDHLDRALHATRTDSALNGWTMEALGSAVRFSE